MLGECNVIFDLYGCEHINMFLPEYRKSQGKVRGIGPEASELMPVVLEMAKHFLPKRKNEFTFAFTYRF